MSILSQPTTLATIFGSSRVIGNITVQCTISEDTNDTLTITKQPVQLGAPMTDHSYLEPTAFTMHILQQNNSGIIPSISQLTSQYAAPANGGLAQIYQQFLDLQALRTPFNVLTPKRIYKDMLIATIAQHTDRKTENILSLAISFQHVNLVPVGFMTVPAANQADAGATQATQKIGKQSTMVDLAQGIDPNVKTYQGPAPQ